MDSDKMEETVNESCQDIENVADSSIGSVATEDIQEENGEDSEMTVTLDEVLQLQDKMIEDTAAVLGAVSDKACSYSEGYVKRQALYSCLTCIPEARSDPEKRNGVCLACSYHCHDGHELVELYTKRNFRCDCGNSKFNGFKCNLLPIKDETNELNAYNQNYSGVYCVCHRPYPDPEDPLPDEMIQCIICEDWYHSRHLGVPLPQDSFSEMICETCVHEHEFLLHYDAYCSDSTECAIVDILGDTTSDQSGSNQGAVQDELLEECKMPKKKSENVSARFLQDISWRKHLCTCPDCIAMYRDQGVLFLTDPTDPVHLYEELGKQRVKEAIETQDRQLMNSVNRVQLVEAIAGYNELKEALAEYLNKFAENKKVVRPEDIKEFFEGMKARKKQKTEMSYYCR